MKFFFSLLCGIFLLPAWAQQVFYGGLFPELGITQSLRRMHVALKVESQHGVFDNRLPEGTRGGYFHDRTDLQFFAGTKVSPLVKLDLGYHYRIQQTDVNYHRVIQQLAAVQRFSRFKLAHRLRTDQNFIPNEPLQLRVRYRPSIEIPLQGHSLDAGEYYLHLNVESIYSWQSGTGDFENRIAGSLGKAVSQQMKWEAGLDYRADRFVAPGFRERLWFKVGWFYALQSRN